ncbi:hypothetical protein ACC754_43380, partial [Rhizobium johnstonii]
GTADNTQINNFLLKGDGFGANGSFNIGKGGLISADFDSVKLSSLDDFALHVLVEIGEKRYRAGIPAGDVDDAAVLHLA